MEGEGDDKGTWAKGAGNTHSGAGQRKGETKGDRSMEESKGAAEWDGSGVSLLFARVCVMAEWRRQAGEFRAHMHRPGYGVRQRRGGEQGKVPFGPACSRRLVALGARVAGVDGPSSQAYGTAVGGGKFVRTTARAEKKRRKKHDILIAGVRGMSAFVYN